jgi:hypothetical protein
MFKCDGCKVHIGPRVAVHHRVLETRPKVYTNTAIDEETGEERLVNSHGWEIVREAKLCKACFEASEAF